MYEYRNCQRNASEWGIKMSKKKYIDLDKAVDIGYLGDWYQSSIDTTVPPIWTDEHLEELCNDFILVPKDTTPDDVEEVRHGKWEQRLIAKNGVAEMKSICSECGKPNKKYEPPYCPHCGAKMDKERE